MHLDPAIALAAFVVGGLVGLTGVGGGALMTPMLVLFFNIAPSAAIASDLVAALFMKPLGVLVHWRRGTVRTTLVADLALGSVPGAFAGTFFLHLVSSSESLLERLLGVALITGAGALFVRAAMKGRPDAHARRRRRVATIAVGLVGGLMVGLTSVGAGSLMAICVLMLHPDLGAGELVGTDLAQSVPLTLSATLGTMLFNHVGFGLTASLIVGSLPGVLFGSLISSRVRGGALRLVVTAAIMLSGLKYVGASSNTLVIATGALALLVAFLALRARRNSVPEAVEDVGALLPARLDRDA